MSQHSKKNQNDKTQTNQKKKGLEQLPGTEHINYILGSGILNNPHYCGMNSSINIRGKRQGQEGVGNSYDFVPGLIVGSMLLDIFD